MLLNTMLDGVLLYIASVFAFLVFFSLNAMERFCGCRFRICSFLPQLEYHLVGLYLQPAY